MHKAQVIHCIGINHAVWTISCVTLWTIFVHSLYLLHILNIPSIICILVSHLCRHDYDSMKDSFRFYKNLCTYQIMKYEQWFIFMLYAIIVMSQRSPPLQQLRESYYGWLNGFQLVFDHVPCAVWCLIAMPLLIPPLNHNFIWISPPSSPTNDKMSPVWNMSQNLKPLLQLEILTFSYVTTILYYKTMVDVLCQNKWPASLFW